MVRPLASRPETAGLLWIEPEQPRSIEYGAGLELAQVKVLGDNFKHGVGFDFNEALAEELHTEREDFPAGSRRQEQGAVVVEFGIRKVPG